MKEEKKTVVATLCFPIRKTHILLGRKKCRLGAGFWNGFGGRLEEGETIIEATLRELEEECGLSSFPRSLRQVAFLSFHYSGEVWDVHTFFSDAWRGDIQESEEMENITWFPFARIPYDDMWADDRIWLPIALTGKKIRGHVYFKKDNKSLKNMEIKTVDSF